MGYLEDRMNLAGKKAIVLGGGGGLGRACALDLARAGVDIALVDRDEPRLRECQDMVTACDVACVAEAFDVRDAERMTRFFELVDRELGPAVDILVNVVGGTFR